MISKILAPLINVIVSIGIFIINVIVSIGILIINVIVSIGILIINVIVFIIIFPNELYRVFKRRT